MIVMPDDVEGQGNSLASRVVDSMKSSDGDAARSPRHDEKVRSRQSGRDQRNRNATKKKSKQDKPSKKRNNSNDHRQKKHSRKDAVSRKKHTRKHHRRDDSSSASSGRSNSDGDSGSSSGSSSDSSSVEEQRKRRRTDETAKSSKNDSIVPINAQVANVAYKNNEERQERRMLARAALIENKFGYTADSNPFNDPNLVETFVWNKKKQQEGSNRVVGNQDEPAKKRSKTKAILLIDEIDKVRERRQNREEQKMEMERIKAEESRMKEYEHYDKFQQKEEQFHLQQQKIRSAIRLINHREHPIDIFAKHILLFGGLSSSSTTTTTADSSSSPPNDYTSVTKYQEQYNVLDIAMETLDIEIEEPYILLKSLKLQELQDLLLDIDAFRKLEREATGMEGMSPSSNHAILLQYWDNLHIVTIDEMKYLQHQSGSGNDVGNTSMKNHSRMVQEISNIFIDQSVSDLVKMKDEISKQLRNEQSAPNDDETYDTEYWTFVREQIMVYIAKHELSELHSQMLTRQLERLEQKRQELLVSAATTNTSQATLPHLNDNATSNIQDEEERNQGEMNNAMPANVPVDMLDDLEEELGLTSEIMMPHVGATSTQQGHEHDEQYRARKPRYYNRVKSGYDWSKYNQTHYDRDNPPPRIVQGYKFNVFYPDLINPMITPQYVLEPVVMNGTVSTEYCMIRFRGGPPYEDIAFQIVNREWNRSRKRGYKCTFERGILSLYFNFTTHWYRK